MALYLNGERHRTLVSKATFKSKPEQIKNGKIIMNGKYEIKPDNGYTLSMVNIEVAVPTNGTGSTDIISSGLYGSNISWSLYKDGTLVISGVGSMPDGDTGESPFANNELIKYVIIQDGITNIGAFVFLSCVNMESIYIPNSVSQLGIGAFNSCVNLRSLTIPDGVTNIPSICDGCVNLANVVIPSSVTSIDSWAFYNCSALTSITIPIGVTNIDSEAFYNCTNLKDVFYVGTKEQWGNITIDSGNESLINANLHCSVIIDSGSCGNNVSYVLYENGLLHIKGQGGTTDYSTNMFNSPFTALKSKITHAIIDDGVTSIGSAMFANCSNLTNISIPNSVKSIGTYAFWKSRIDNLVIPNGVIVISPSAFHFCSSLTSVIIPDSVQNISGSAFAYCSNLTNIVIPDSVTSIGSRTFSGCSKLNNVILPKDLTTISSYTFQDCANLKTIKIPASVTKIDSSAFDATPLESIYYNGTQEDWENISITTGFNEISNSSIYCEEVILTKIQ